MDEYKTQLILNKVESKAVYDWLSQTGKIGINELYLIQHDDSIPVISINYDNTNKKLYYTNDTGDNKDIITVAALQNAMTFSTVAASGSYVDLTNLPSINNVALSGNKTTAELNISYDDLTNLPVIPTVTTTYTATDQTLALSGVAVASALQSYVLTSRQVVGTGALGGGGTLTNNISITHNLAPIGLTPAAVKIAADQYGHVQIGTSITAADINAISTTYSIQPINSIDATNHGTILSVISDSDTFGFSTEWGDGVPINIYCLNNQQQTTTLTIPNTYSNIDYCYCNGVLLTSPTTIQIPANNYKKINIIYFKINSEIYMFIEF